MRLFVKMRFALALVAGLTLSQCGVNLGMFPDFLTAVSQHRNVGDYFQHVTGEKFIFYTIYANGANTDFVYVIQVLPNGNRRLLVLNGVLGTVISADNPSVGRMHIEIDNFTHLTGMDILRFPVSVAPTLIPDPNLPPLAGACQDFTMTRFSPTSNYLMFFPPLFAGSVTQLPWQTFSYGSGFSFAANGTITVPLFNRNFSMEAVGGNNGSWISVVLRDISTSDGFIFRFSGDNPGSGNIDLGNFFPIDRIVEGTAQVTPDGEIAVQTYNGRLTRFSSNGSHDNDAPATDFLGYLIAYGTSQSMYLFNPSTFEVLKTRSWWNNFNY